MFNNGLKVKIKGIPFEKEQFTDFTLLKKNTGNNKKQSTIIYGRNGSGKTSICNAINELKTNSSEDFITKFVDENNNDVVFDYEKQLYVFNEHFINDKVRFTTTDGLDTIVLLGNEKVQEDDINKCKNLVKKHQDELDKINLSIYEDIKNDANPDYVMNKIINTLKQDGNWASIQQKILRKARKATVNEAIVKSIVDNHSEKISYDEFNRMLEDFLKIKDNDTKCNEFLQTPLNRFDEDIFNNFMGRKLVLVSNDEMAKRILTTIENHSEIRTNEIVKTFDSDIDYCPYCFRPINKDEKFKVIEKIKSALSKESDDFINELEKLKLIPYEVIELPDFITEKSKGKYLSACNGYNRCIDEINNYIEKKKLNLYLNLTPILSNDYITYYNQLETVIEAINKEIASYNCSIDKYEETKNGLMEYCNYLSWNTIKDLYSEYEKKLKNKNDDFQKFKKITELLDSSNKRLRELNSKKANIKVAISEINKTLSFILLDKNRLRLSLSDNHYVVQSNGKHVPLAKLSTGERNIISLCYFFCSIGEGKEANNRHNDEYLILIDDPISSFDHDNKIGIYTFLRSKINEYKNSNFVFLTHSYEVGYNLAKIFNDIYGEKKSTHIRNYSEIRACYVINGSLNLENGKNQYNLLINEIFKYANYEDSELNDFTIGNSIRRVLEMFSSFEYNDGFVRIIDHLDDSCKINIFLKNYMYRIMLNNESHLMLTAYAYDEVNRFEMFSSDEKHKTAKLCLIMLKILNNKHINSYIKDNQLNQLENWKNDIEASIDLEVDINEQNSNKKLCCMGS